MSEDNITIDTIPKEVFDRLNPLVRAYFIWEKENSKKEKIIIEEE